MTTHKISLRSKGVTFDTQFELYFEQFVGAHYSRKTLDAPPVCSHLPSTLRTSMIHAHS